MKKNILFTVLLVGATSFCAVNAQETEPEKASWSPYVAAGLSISNSGKSDFASTSYPSVEVGIMKNCYSFGLVCGRSSLAPAYREVASLYWYELKTAVSFPLGPVSAYAVLGIGNYMSTEQIFVEYGLGFSHSFGKFGVFGQASNWDGTWYVTPGVSFSF